jgi:hypothetical protein
MAARPSLEGRFDQRTRNAAGEFSPPSKALTGLAALGLRAHGVVVLIVSQTDSKEGEFPMWSLFQRNARQAKPARRTPLSYRPRLEVLEDRTLLSGTTAGNAQLLQEYGQLPLSFEANEGQTAAPVNFLSRGNGYALFLTPGQAVLELQKPAASGTSGSAPSQPATTEVLSMQLVGGNAAPAVVGLDQQTGVSN